MLAVSATRTEAPIASVRARAYKFPTDTPYESDGTLTWASTTMVYAEICAGGKAGVGYTYADAGAAALINDMLSERLAGADALQTAACAAVLWAAVRNNGPDGLAAMAVSALDIALWDLKGKLLDAPVCVLLGAARRAAPVYGSGGFTSYDLTQLTSHMAGWVDEYGIPRVKMKVGREPQRDAERVAAVRSAIGPNVELFVDANGAYDVKPALAMAQRFAQSDVVWFEEPVDHRNLPGNAAVRARAPVSMEIANGEYAFTVETAGRIVDAGAVDVLQGDVTRCGGLSGFLAVDALCDARGVPLSTHCAPAVTLHAALAAKRLRHMEYFYDHVQIERRFFDGAASLAGGALAPDLTRAGIGLALKADAEAYAL